ncbi:MAG: asparagine synthase (glutamine-hydrolyzing) [Bacteroidota bacterium]|jgi:asparagine synthase (glutamine-hydrolysing)
MCGIAGIIQSSGVPLVRLARMSQILQHRGPDDEGFVLVDEAGNLQSAAGGDSVEQIRALYPRLENIDTGDHVIRVGLAHRRLSILDLSEAGHQPMLSHDARYVITYNGEVYNYLELRAELELQGTTFRTGTDTEVVLAAWEFWGPQCLDKLVGMWAFCLYDVQENTVFLVRDRFGIKPLYYTDTQIGIVFSSELKAIVQTAESRPVLDAQATAEFLFYGSTVDPSGIMIRDISEVPEGCYLVYQVDDKSSSIVRYYDLNQVSASTRTPASAEDAYTRFTELLNNSIELHLRSDVPVGVCLSGGLDSSYIASFLASRFADVPLKTFTAGYHDERFDESRLALTVRDRYPAIDSTIVYPDIETTWSSLDQQIYHHDLPFHSSSMFAQWSVMESVKKGGIKVVMNGQGSDELIGGYYNFAGQMLLGLLFQMRLARFSREYSALKKGFTKHIETDILRAMYNYLPAYVQAKARKSQRIGAKILGTSYVQLAIGTGNDTRSRRSYRGLAVESVRFGLQQLLRYEDRISMAFSIESRVPFLDHRFAELVLSMRPEWKIRDGWTKYPLRQSGKGLVPEGIRQRRDKMGFLTPAEVWLSEKNSEIRTFVADSRIRSLIDFDAYNTVFSAEHRDPTHISEWWKIFILAKWLENYDIQV